MQQCRHAAEKAASALQSPTQTLAFNQQSSIKVPRVDYVPRVTVMERRYSLTSPAIVFHINLGKHDWCTFWLWSCATSCFIELWWDFWWIFAVNSFHANSGCWLWFTGTDALSSQKAILLSDGSRLINQSALFFWSPVFKTFFFPEER